MLIRNVQASHIYYYTNFSGYDCHLFFEEFLTQASNHNYNITIIPKTMENYVSVQIGCIRFSDFL